MVQHQLTTLSNFTRAVHTARAYFRPENEQRLTTINNDYSTTLAIFEINNKSTVFASEAKQSRSDFYRSVYKFLKIAKVEYSSTNR